jgi:peptide/nickel transport system substrate-binding protein
MEIIKPKKRNVHPYVPELEDLYLKGRITRREFLRNATLLGVSLTSASAFLAACGAQPAPEEPAAEEPAAEEPAAEEPAEEAAPAGGPVRGGTYTASMQLQLLDHPARLSWVEGANIVRQINEYLTETGPDNVTRPYLLDRWEASEDVKTWDLYLKQGIKWNNGDDFTADDVMFTFGEWLNEDVGSSMLALLAYLTGMQDVEGG